MADLILLDSSSDNGGCLLGITNFRHNRLPRLNILWQIEVWKWRPGTNGLASGNEGEDGGIWVEISYENVDMCQADLMSRD